MDRVAFGRTGLTVPRLGLGTVKLGRNRDVKYPESFELPDDATVERLLAAALDEGVVFWDTAPAYGTSEERLGPFVKTHRDRLVICTKAGEEFGPAGSTHDFSRDAITASVHRSLRRLRTDVIDVVLLHSAGHDESALVGGEARESLEALVEVGDVRAIGLSAKTSEGIDAAARGLDVVMAAFSVDDRRHEAALRRAHAQGVGVLAIKVLGQGHAVRSAAEDPVESALRSVLSTGAVHCAVVGTRSPEHLRHAARAAGRVLDPDGDDAR